MRIHHHQVLFGVTTDTYDVMGMVQEAKGEEEIPAAMEKRDEHERRTTDRRRRREEEDGLDGEGGDVAEPAPKKTATESGKDAAEERQCVNPLGEEEGANDQQIHSNEKDRSIEELESAVRAILPSFVGKRSQVYRCLRLRSSLCQSVSFEPGLSTVLIRAGQRQTSLSLGSSGEHYRARERSADHILSSGGGEDEGDHAAHPQDRGRDTIA